MKYGRAITTRQMLLGLAALGLSVGITSSALANGPLCRTRTLKGTYIFTTEGWQNRPSTTTPPGDRRPVAYTGIETYDGEGSFTGINTLTTARSLTSTNPPVEVEAFSAYSGTYTVNDDCTVTWEATDSAGFVSHYHLFLSPDGERFTFIQVDPDGVVGQGVAYRGKR